MAARKCYVAMMKMDNHLQAMSIEEHRTTTEPVKKLEEVFLDDSNHERTTKIGTLANPTVRQEYLPGPTRTCLRVSYSSSQTQAVLPSPYGSCPD